MVDEGELESDIFDDDPGREGFNHLSMGKPLAGESNNKGDECV